MTATWVRESKRIECLMITLLTIFWLVHLAPVMNNRRQESSRRHFCLRQLECLQRPGNVRFWIINSASLLPTSQLEKFYESFMQKRLWKHDDGMGVLIEWTKLWAKLLLYWYIRIWCLMSIMCHCVGTTDLVSAALIVAAVASFIQIIQVRIPGTRLVIGKWLFRNPDIICN